MPFFAALVFDVYILALSRSEVVTSQLAFQRNPSFKLTCLLVADTFDLSLCFYRKLMIEVNKYNKDLNKVLSLSDASWGRKFTHPAILTVILSHKSNIPDSAKID